MRQSNPWKSSGSSEGGNGGKRRKKIFEFTNNGEDLEVNIPEEWKHMPEKWMKAGRKAAIIAGIVAVLVLAFCYWWFHPAINIHNGDMWVFICLIMAVLFIVFRAYRIAYAKGVSGYSENPKKAQKFKRLSLIPVIVVIIAVLGALMSATFFPGNAERYATLLTTSEENFSTDIEEVDYNSIPVIDRDSAALLGNRTMGEIADYVSQFEISDIYSQINYHGRPVRVSPLNYADIIKWFTNCSSGIPAYVIVDMASQDTQIVRLDNPIYYSESDPFVNNIDRYVQLKYPTYMFDQKSFEIDEDGTPYWVCPVQDYTIGLFGGKTISRVVLCNASTGECQDLAIGDVPEWVDRAYPTDLLIEQYNYSGLYVNGWWNSWLGQEGVKQTTPGTSGNLGYNYIAKDDDVWVYTGVTSATADNSIIGFVLINQRTAESHFYSVSGATEDSAMLSAEGQVQNLKYTATFPLLLNINGQPTYFMSLKDSAGLVKKYAMVDIQRYQNVAVGDTVSDCQKSYKALLSSNGIVDTSSSDTGATVASGTIATMAQAVIDGNSHFYVTLEGDSHIYDVPISLIDVVSYKEGQTITLHYYEGSPTSTVTKIGE